MPKKDTTVACHNDAQAWQQLSQFVHQFQTGQISTDEFVRSANQLWADYVSVSSSDQKLIDATLSIADLPTNLALNPTEAGLSLQEVWQLVTSISSST